MGKKRSAAPKQRRKSSTGSAVSATEAQNNFGEVLERVVRDDVVFITKYARPTAVVLSIDRYDALTGSGATELEELTREFDEMVARMQTDAAERGLDALFEMDGEELGAAAVRDARRATD